MKNIKNLLGDFLFSPSKRKIKTEEDEVIRKMKNGVEIGEVEGINKKFRR